MTAQELITSFKTLDYTTQYEKVFAILDQIKDLDPVFKTFYDTLSMIKVSESVLVYIYESIFSIIDDIQKGNMAKARSRIEQMTDILKRIHEEEAADKIREWNPDNLLNNL